MENSINFKTIKNRTYGFNLLELMLVIAILAITTVYAIPSMRQWYAEQNIESEANQLVAITNFAITEGLRSGYQVSLCGADIVSGKLSNAGCTGNWNNGVLLYQDVDNSGDYNNVNEKIKLISFNNNVQITPSQTQFSFNNQDSSGNKTICLSNTLNGNSFYAVKVAVSAYGAAIVCRENNNANCGGC